MKIILPHDPEIVEDVSADQWLDGLRHHRDRLLAACDWTQVADAPVDRAAWAAYRQALRDFPATWTPGPEADFPNPPGWIEPEPTPEPAPVTEPEETIEE